MMLLKTDRMYASYLAIYQGTFYLATGVWPLVSAGTFQKVTGPKFDFWLVKTVGLLVGLIGAWAAAFCRQSRRQSRPGEAGYPEGR